VTEQSNDPKVVQNVYIQQVPKGLNHLLHLVLTICTGGLWGFVWAGLAIGRALRR